MISHVVEFWFFQLLHLHDVLTFISLSISSHSCTSWMSYLSCNMQSSWAFVDVKYSVLSYHMNIVYRFLDSQLILFVFKNIYVYHKAENDNLHCPSFPFLCFCSIAGRDNYLSPFYSIFMFLHFS